MSEMEIFTVNVLKFQAIFTFFSQIKCWLSGLELIKCLSEFASMEDPDQTASQVWPGFALFVKAFSRFEILEHLSYMFFMSISVL